MKKFGALRAGALLVGVVFVFSIFALGVNLFGFHPSSIQKGKLAITKDLLADTIGPFAKFYEFPEELDFDLGSSERARLKVQYTLDAKLQRTMGSLFKSYSPDYGAFVALDAETGRVLSMVSYSRDGGFPDNLALKASFPSASVFKVVTATAAIESRKMAPETVVSFNGRNHTLYKGQILKSNVTRWTHFITFKDAFARSINTVFGKVGAFTVGQSSLKTYADRFGFNRKIAGDLPVQEGRAPIPNDAWGLAETASGYTLENTMSPIQGALMAAAVANNGVMMEPFMVQSLTRADGAHVYLGEPKVAGVTMDTSTAHQLRTLMKETVLHGTSRGAFRGFFKSSYALLDVGGKTGSLTGYHPKGKYDWFVGYASFSSRKIAIAALTIHEKQWRVKSSYLARRAIETFYQEALQPRNVANR
jgi:cell division protein FtsI/penicillin-binding protein 2